MDGKGINDFFKKHGKDDSGQPERFSMAHNFLGVFPADVVKIVSDELLTKPYPFCIVNTDPSNKPGQHWVLFHPLKNMKRPSCMLFDSFGKLSLAHLYVSDDSQLIKKFVTNANPLKDREKKFDYFKWEINCDRFLALSKKEKDELSDTARGFFFLVASYLKHYNKIHDTRQTTIDLFGLIDPIQSTKKTTCGAYCLYYIYHMFHPDPSFNLHNDKGDIKTVKKIN